MVFFTNIAKHNEFEIMKKYPFKILVENENQYQIKHKSSISNKLMTPRRSATAGGCKE